MEINYQKTINCTLDFDPEEVAKTIVREYKKDNKEIDPKCEYIIFELDKRLFYYLEKMGLTDEQESDIVWYNMEGNDCLLALKTEVRKCLENKYGFTNPFEHLA